MNRWVRVAAFWIALAAGPASAQDPPPRGVVVDQTGLPLPGVTATLRRAERLSQRLSSARRADSAAKRHGPDGPTPAIDGSPGARSTCHRSAISPVLEIRSDFRTRRSARVHAGEVVTAADTLIDEMITRPGRQTSRLCAQSTWELRLK